MNVDQRARRAAQGRAATSVVNVEDGLRALHQHGTRRAAERGVLLVSTTTLAADVAWTASSPLRRSRGHTAAGRFRAATSMPTPPPSFRVVDSAVSPSGTRVAFAAFRNDAAPGVFVRGTKSADLETWWSAPRPRSWRVPTRRGQLRLPGRRTSPG